MLRKVIACMLSAMLLLLAPYVQAAAPPPAPGKVAETKTHGPRKQLQTIVFAGLAGAILGLSTLSFYGRPQDRLVNVPMGFAVGVITGTIYTTFKAASEPKDFYGAKDPTKAELWAVDDSHWRTPPAVTPRSTFQFQF